MQYSASMVPMRTGLIPAPTQANTEQHGRRQQHNPFPGMRMQHSLTCLRRYQACAQQTVSSREKQQDYHG